MKTFLNKLTRSRSHGGVVARGAIGVFLVNSSGAGLLFGLHIILARLLGAEQYGHYAYAWTWVRILAVLCLLGFQASLVRFIAEYRSKKQWGLFRGLFKKSRQFVLGFSLVIFFAGSVFVWFLGARIPAELKITFYIAFGILPLYTLVQLQASFLIGLKNVARAKLLTEVIRPISIGIILFFLFFCSKGTLNAPQAMAANLTAVLLTAFAGALFLARFLPGEVRRARPEFAVRKWLRVSLPLLLVAAMHIILRKTDIVILGILQGSESTGIYSAAINVSGLAAFALVAVNTILEPIISELYHTGQKNNLQRIITLSVRPIFIFNLIVSSFLIIFGRPVLGLFGPAFVAAYNPLLILLSGQVVNSLTGSVGSIMSMSGRQNALGVIFSASTGLNILLNFILIPRFGLTGAAAATAVSMVIWKVAMLIYVRNKLGINSTVLGRV